MTTADDLRRLSAQSRERVKAARALQATDQHVVAHSRRRLEAGRLVLDRRRATVAV